MKVATALVVTLALALVGVRPALAIHNGVPDGDAHPNVGFLAFDVDGEGETPPFALCSGSVISDSVFLTAAHCIAAIPGVQWVVSLEGGSPADPVTTTGFFPDLDNESGASVRGADSAFTKNALFTSGVTMVMPSATTAGSPLV